MSLLSRLFLLVSVALLPAIALQTYDEYDLLRMRRVEAENQALSVAKLAATEQQQFIEGIRQVLIALSEVPAIKAKNIPACNAYLSVIQQRYPAFLTFSVTDLTGRSICDTIKNHDPVTAAGRRYFATALSTGEFTVGAFSIGRLSGRNVLHFALPYYDDQSRMGGVIVVALSLDWLADSVAHKDLPRGGALAITDRNGTYLARYPRNEQYVGKKMPDARPWRAASPGMADRPDLDGVERLVGYATLSADSGGLLVTFALDKAQVFGEIRYHARRGILLIIISTLLVLTLTWLGARQFIHRPLSQLLDVAIQWRLGNYGRRANIGERNSEFARVGDAFNIMADALEDREGELRRAKETAEEAAARITTVFESTTDSVAIVDRDWRISYLNERARMQIAKNADVIGKALWTVRPHLIGTEADRFYREAMSTGRPISFEVFTPHDKVWFGINVFPSSLGLTLYFRDITEQKRALEARRLIEEQLHQSQKMEAVGQLTGGIAHDFNNLLTVVAGNLVLIEDHAEDSDAVRQFAAAGLQAADRGATLTAQLLAFSRRQSLNPKVVYVGRLVREFQGLLRRAVRAGCEVRLITDAQLWACQVDPAQLETALLNLTLNGRDAMADGGVLEINARDVILEDNAVVGVASGAYVCVSVSDTGCGMSPETLSRVFEPFFTTKEIGKGTGLGLSMVYSFAKQSNGHVAIESTLGLGTTVTLFLPKIEVLPVAEEDALPKDAVPAGSGRVLVVEDDDQLLTVTSMMLTRLGYDVRSAWNGAEAIRMLTCDGDEPFDLLFSDVSLPQGMNGVELAREARRLRPGIKIVLTSGYADALARHGALDTFPVLRKPFRQADLARCLWSVLQETDET